MKMSSDARVLTLDADEEVISLCCPCGMLYFVGPKAQIIRAAREHDAVAHPTRGDRSFVTEVLVGVERLLKEQRSLSTGGADA